MASPVAPPPQAMEVVLTAMDDRIVPEVRRLTLSTGKTMPIGRSSKSPSKPELMAGPANAYIDSPVVSREHAHFSVKPSTPDKLAVYITDNRSMHGTMINGVKLHATVPNRLFDGDELQFGSDVARNDTFFVARKYKFNSISASKHSSPDHRSQPKGQGYAVPDTDSSDDEDIEVDEVKSTPAFLGTQSNPVPIHDPQTTSVQPLDQTIQIQDKASEPAVEKEQASARTVLTPLAKDTDTRETPSKSTSNYQVQFAEHGAISDDGDSISVYSSEESDLDAEARQFTDDDMEDDLSEASAMSQPGMSVGDLSDEAVSEYGMSDDDVGQEYVEEDFSDEDDEADTTVPHLDVEATRRMKMEIMLNHEQYKVSDNHESLASEHPVAPPKPSQSKLLPDSLLTHDPADEHIASKGAYQDLDAHVRNGGLYLNASNTFYHPMDNYMFGQMPLDPSLSTRSEGEWNGVSYAPLPHYQQRMQVAATEETHSSAPNMSHNGFALNMPDQPSNSAGDNCLYAKPSAALLTPVLGENTWFPLPGNAPSAAVAQTPPAQSSETASPPQLRRTKVSIPEIVEEAPQQPPTPTSVSGALKRKADVLEEEVEEAISNPSPPTSNAEEMPMTTTTLSSSAVDLPKTTQERPKKRLRSRLGSVAKNFAAYVVPAVVLTVGVITQLPEGFYKE